MNHIALTTEENISLFPFDVAKDGVQSMCSVRNENYLVMLRSDQCSHFLPFSRVSKKMAYQYHGVSIPSLSQQR